MSLTTPLLVIGGPTAVGKSRIGAIVAQALGGEVLCADSRQLYRDIPVTSAQPDAADLARAPHHLFGVLDPAEPVSAGKYRELAEAAIGEVRGRGGLPVLVGGTGFYLAAATGGMSLAPPVDPAVLSVLERRVAVEGLETLWRELLTLDAASARRIMPGDAYRIVRALAIHRQTGQTASSFGGLAEPMPHRLVVLTMERAALMARIEARCAAMLERDALAEADALRARRLDPRSPVLRALGMPHLFAAAAGAITPAVALERMQRDSRRYAKRQLTWFRGRVDAVWVDAADPERAAGEVVRLARES